MSRVLVTGGSGFTGSKLCRRLRHEGEDVVAFVRPQSRIGPLEKLGVECLKVDITDRQAVAGAFQGISKVYHLAVTSSITKPRLERKSTGFRDVPDVSAVSTRARPVSARITWAASAR